MLWAAFAGEGGCNLSEIARIAYSMYDLTHTYTFPDEIHRNRLHGSTYKKYKDSYS